MAEWYTLIGDLVGSRRLLDRGAAQARVNDVLAAMPQRLAAVQPLEPTVGDEFQGAFERLADAVTAALAIRLELLPEVDVRCGLGFGEVAIHDPDRRPVLQDGPGWWAARDALEELGRPRRSGARTWFVGPESARVNSFLLTRDALVDRLGDRGRRMLALALGGASQREIAEIEQVSKSAVSQQFARGVGALRDAQLTFGKGE
jgi:hypothetical protein